MDENGPTSGEEPAPGMPPEPEAGRTPGNETGAGEAGVGQTGASPARPGQSGAGWTGAGRTGAGQTGAGQTGAGQTGAGQTGAGAALASGPEPEPERLLGELASLRRRTRSARHAYWLPLVLYSVLICAAAPLYVQHDDSRGSGGYPSGPQIQVPGLGGSADGYIAIYWLFALVAGFWLTALWYRRRGRRAGLLTSARVFIIVGVTVTAAVILLSVVPPVARLWPGDLVIRGTFPLFVIAVGLLALAWAERSWALVATAIVFTGAALLSNLYNVENILFRLGWNPGPGQLGLTALPGALLPAVVLLVAGLCAFPAQRPRRLAPQ